MNNKINRSEKLTENINMEINRSLKFNFRTLMRK